jgi:hypothetical protein
MACPTLIATSPETSSPSEIPAITAVFGHPVSATIGPASTASR